MKVTKILLGLFCLLPLAVACQQPAPTSVPAPARLSDEALLDLVQRQTLRYFWEFGHPTSGLARERSNTTFGYGHETCTTGGTGFGVMAIVAGVERKWITREEGAARIQKIANFLFKAPNYHGAFPHWMDGETGKTIPFGRKDDGGDLVETSFLFQGLLCARAYFDQNNAVENDLRQKITWMWDELEFDWYTQGSANQLYWHWSPNNGWAMNFELRGWNETLITYILGASSRRYPISREHYDKCWAQSSHFKNGKSYYGITLPLGFEYGGPLFFTHYSFLGLDPRGLKDQYADYWQQNQNHTLINYQHCVANPNKFKGYGPNCWGLTASDNHEGYNAHSPDNDLGVITPTAALSAFPYTPKESMAALRYFYEQKGAQMWGEYGFKDAMNESKNWYADSYLAIDQGPIVVMIENHRSGLFWKLFMKIPEIQDGLKKLGFESPALKKN
jgi:hypothetical protein